MQKISMPYLLKRTIILDQIIGKKKNSQTPSKAYSLFVKILNETKKIAIGKVVLKDKEQHGGIKSISERSCNASVKYLDEIRPMDEIGGYR